MTAKKAINNPEGYLKEIRRKTRRLFTAEQKILIVMEALRAETSIAELCRKHGIQESTFYKWNKDFIEAGKQQLSGDTVRQATSDEVKQLREEFSIQPVPLYVFAEIGECRCFQRQRLSA